MDAASIIGLIVALAAIFITIVWDSMNDFFAFVDGPSFFTVIVGTCGAIAICFPSPTLKAIPSVLRKAFTFTPRDPKHLLSILQDMSKRARREGTLSLEEFINNGTLEDEFFIRGIQLVVDGREPKVIEEILFTEIEKIEERHKGGMDIFNTIGALAPAFGMIGTLIGLVKMLKDMSDPAAIGPAMSVALMTTLYGSLIANCAAIPFAKKLEKRSKEEIEEKELIARGILSILARDNARFLVGKLNVRLPPSERLEEA